MPLRVINRRAGMVLAGALLAGFVSQSGAALVYDIRLPGGGKDVVASVGSVVNFEIHAVIDAGGAGAESFTNGYLKLLSTGAAKGNLTAALAAGFDAGGSSSGAQADLDGDGDLDVGSNNNGSATGWFFARSSQAVPGNDILIGTGSFTVTGAGDKAEINAFGRTKSGATIIPALWAEDGVNKVVSTGGAISGGAPLVVRIPEPASLSLVALGAMALLGRRRQA